MAALLSAVALVASVCVGQDAATAARLPLAPPRAVDAVELAAALGAAAGVRGDARGGRVGVTRAETADGAREFWVAAPLDGGGRRVHGATVGGMVWASGGYALVDRHRRRARSRSSPTLSTTLLRLGAALNGVGDDAIALFGAPAADVAEVAYDGWSTDDAGRPGFNASASTPRRAVRCDDAVEAAEAGWGAPPRRRGGDRRAPRAPGYDVRAAREGGIAWDCAESAHDCDDPPRDARGEGWLDVVDIERGYEAEGARRLLEAAGYCDRREASTARGGCQLEVAAVAVEFTAAFSNAVVPRAAAAMNARQARAAGGEAADFSMYVAVGEEAHRSSSAAATDYGSATSTRTPAPRARARVPRARDASCDATSRSCARSGRGGGGARPA
ncbi:hypothetical protein JL720_4215 [Aureococcus anophagefferens]|nr:hypothetical protein JL720_4215 [Aureococcus anophagefferens]